MRKKRTSSNRTVEQELAAIATVLRQIHLMLKQMVAQDEETLRREEEGRRVQAVSRVMRTSVTPGLLSGRWKNKDGTSYHPLDPKGGALAAEQEQYQRDLPHVDRKKELGRNTDPE